MKSNKIFLTVILVPLDFLALFFAALASYYIRFMQSIRQIRPVSFDLPFALYLDFVLPGVVIWLVIFAGFGLYSFRSDKRIIKQFPKILAACSLGLTLFVFISFFSRELFSSRFIILAAWVLAIFFVTVGRILFRILQLNFFKRGIGVKKIIIIGNDKTTDMIVSYLKKNYHPGYKVLKVFTKINSSNKKQIEEFIKGHEVDEILQSDASLPRIQSQTLLELSDQFHLVFKYAADFFEAQTSNLETSTIIGVPVVEVKKTPLEDWGKVYKRCFDVIVSVMALFVFSPLMLLIALLIKFDSKGPILYKNERVGKKGQKFTTFKFRTMKIEYCTGYEYDNSGSAEVYEKQLIAQKSLRQGPIYKIGNDPRRTKFGRFLEKISLDELPQFFNSLIGNMSIVGPRPHQAREVNHYIKNHPKIFEIKPGITGLAQISGRSDLSFNEEMKLDLYYLENWSFWKDLIISLKTPFTILFKPHKS